MPWRRHETDGPARAHLTVGGRGGVRVFQPLNAGFSGRGQAGARGWGRVAQERKSL